MNQEIKVGTLAFLINNDKVLLGLKKRGFAQGKWNGFGGKKQLGETIENTMVRELAEECGVLAVDYIYAALLDFQNEKDDAWTVWVYVVTAWKGEVAETDEMEPKWFPINNLPFDLMWPDDREWLPRVLGGEKIKGRFVLENGNLKSFDIIEA